MKPPEDFLHKITLATIAFGVSAHAESMLLSASAQGHVFGNQGFW